MSAVPTAGEFFKFTYPEHVHALGQEGAIPQQIAADLEFILSFLYQRAKEQFSGKGTQYLKKFRKIELYYGVSPKPDTYDRCFLCSIEVKNSCRFVFSDVSDKNEEEIKKNTVLLLPLECHQAIHHHFYSRERGLNPVLLAKLVSKCRKRIERRSKP